MGEAMTDAMQEIKEKVQSLKRIVLAATFGEPHSFGINEEERDWLLGTITASLAEVERLQTQQNANCLQRDALAIDLAALRRENATMREALEIARRDDERA